MVAKDIMELLFLVEKPKHTGLLEQKMEKLKDFQRKNNGRTKSMC